jgi:hypothetical protein
MEELRTQFQNAKEQHEKALEDIAAERTLEISQLKESHEALLLAMTQERDTVSESLKVWWFFFISLSLVYIYMYSVCGYCAM